MATMAMARDGIRRGGAVGRAAGGDWHWARVGITTGEGATSLACIW